MYQRYYEMLSSAGYLESDLNSPELGQRCPPQTVKRLRGWLLLLPEHRTPINTRLKLAVTPPTVPLAQLRNTLRVQGTGFRPSIQPIGRALGALPCPGPSLTPRERTRTVPSRARAREPCPAERAPASSPQPRAHPGPREP